MYSNTGSLVPWASTSGETGTTWTTRFQGEENGNETETFPDGSTVESGSDEEQTLNNKTSSKSRENEAIEQVLPTTPSCSLVNGRWVCHPYKIEQLERQLFNNSPGAGRRTAIIETLRQSEFLVYY